MPLDNKTSEDTFNDCLCSILPYELPVRMTTDTLPQTVIEGKCLTCKSMSTLRRCYSNKRHLIGGRLVLVPATYTFFVCNPIP